MPPIWIQRLSYESWHCWRIQEFVISLWCHNVQQNPLSWPPPKLDHLLKFTIFSGWKFQFGHWCISNLSKTRWPPLYWSCELVPWEVLLCMLMYNYSGIILWMKWCQIVLVLPGIKLWSRSARSQAWSWAADVITCAHCGKTGSSVLHSLVCGPPYFQPPIVLDWEWKVPSVGRQCQFCRILKSTVILRLFPGSSDHARLYFYISWHLAMSPGSSDHARLYFYYISWHLAMSPGSSDHARLYFYYISWHLAMSPWIQWSRQAVLLLYFLAFSYVTLDPVITPGCTFTIFPGI